MESEITELLEVLYVALKTIETSVDEDSPNFSHDDRERFVDIQLKFDSVSKLFSYQQFNGRDYLRAVNIVKNRGYASVSELSRKLGIIYKQSVEMINEMERQGIVKTLDQETPVKGIRTYNYGYKQNE
ncbi:DNA translocase FtsK [Desulfobacter vibrioformis]|uniref:DNA translocase FtsK n=1 Tax=Desulfobacter vibrioformis TaxID=34031 RepID=UPI000A015BB0|nr:DNA translocase FtsK [Desulfobacter vibrioformis]